MRKLLILPMLALLLAFGCQHRELNDPVTVEDWLAEAAKGGMSDSLQQELAEVLSNDELREDDPKAWRLEIERIYVASNEHKWKAILDTTSDPTAREYAQSKYDSLRQIRAERSGR